MPTYEYACMDCGTHVEVFQHFSDDPLTTCGNCGGRLRKVFHPAGILFKGSGFYKTDSRTGSRSSKTDSGGAGAKKPAASSSSGSGSSSTSDSGGSTGEKKSSSGSSSSAAAG